MQLEINTLLVSSRKTAKNCTISLLHSCCVVAFSFTEKLISYRFDGTMGHRLKIALNVAKVVGDVGVPERLKSSVNFILYSEEIAAILLESLHFEVQGHEYSC